MDASLLEQYKNLDWNKLLRKDLGEHSLESTQENFNKIKTIFDDILNYPNLDSLSSQFTNEIEAQLRSLIQFSAQILDAYKDTSQKKLFIDKVKNKEFEVFSKLSPVYNYIQTFDPSKDKKLKELVKQSEERILKLNQDLTKAEGLLQNTQKEATKKEILKYGNFFGEEATTNKEKADTNFNLMVCALIGTFLLTLAFLQDISFIEIEGSGFWKNLFNTINSQNVIIKFIILSLGGYLISHFSNTYSTEMHLYNLNIQRQNALNSHKQILGSVISTESDNEKEVRNAILLELTRAIFEAQETGYLKKGGGLSPTNQIIEVTKTLK